MVPKSNQYKAERSDIGEEGEVKVETDLSGPVTKICWHSPETGS